MALGFFFSITERNFLLLGDFKRFHNRRKGKPGSHMDYVGSSCPFGSVTLHKSLTLSKPQLLPLPNGSNSTYLDDCLKNINGNLIDTYYIAVMWQSLECSVLWMALTLLEPFHSSLKAQRKMVSFSTLTPNLSILFLYFSSWILLPVASPGICHLSLSLCGFLLSTLACHLHKIFPCLLLTILHISFLFSFLAAGLLQGFQFLTLEYPNMVCANEWKWAHKDQQLHSQELTSIARSWPWLQTAGWQRRAANSCEELWWQLSCAWRQRSIVDLPDTIFLAPQLCLWNENQLHLDYMILFAN